ncbi:conserved hypothetical protein [Ricinus communis]|uniref:Uncharacterized protein n=1 Tax=Ricinus communis TaxID=3988 RepID=B9TQJ3_RICCO|nr:conserved hypothetical protein [Ricinus communis]
MLAAAARAGVGDPRGGGLRIGEEALVAQAVLVRERGERFAQVHQRPQQQPFGLFPVAVEGRVLVGETSEPCADRIQIVRGGDLRHTASGAVGARAAVERGRNHEPFERGGVRQDEVVCGWCGHGR